MSVVSESEPRRECCTVNRAAAATVARLAPLAGALVPLLDELEGASRRAIELRAVQGDLARRSREVEAALALAFDRQEALVRRVKSAVVDYALGRARAAIAAEADGDSPGPVS